MGDSTTNTPTDELTAESRVVTPAGEQAPNGALTVRDTGAFDVLLSTPATAATPPDSLPQQHSPVFDFSDRAERVALKASVLDWTSLVLAVIVPPLGLLVSILARIVGYTTRRWVSRVAKAATVISVVLSLVLAGGLAAMTLVNGEAEARAQIARDAAPLCSALDASPGLLELPAFGWPTERVAIPQTIEAMKLYQSTWSAFADAAPPTIDTAVRSIASAALVLVTSTESTQVLDRQRNLEQMTAVTAKSGLIAWHTQHCG